MRSLVDQFQAEVFGLCIRMLRHRHDAEDVTQEVFVRIFRSLRRWDATRPLRPWVLGITVMYHEQGRPYEDIADALDRPVGTIKTWLHRARVEVMERLRRRGMVESESATDS